VDVARVKFCKAAWEGIPPGEDGASRIIARLIKDVH
jgi:hypothetical protein